MVCEQVTRTTMYYLLFLVDSVISQISTHHPWINKRHNHISYLLEVKVTNFFSTHRISFIFLQWCPCHPCHITLRIYIQRGSKQSSSSQKIPNPLLQNTPCLHYMKSSFEKLNIKLGKGSSQVVATFIICMHVTWRHLAALSLFWSIDKAFRYNSRAVFKFPSFHSIQPQACNHLSAYV